MFTKEKPFIIAEISGNHNQKKQEALDLILAAKDAGASAVKIQTYTADTITIPSSEEGFIIKDEKSLWKGRNLYDLYQEAYTPWEWHQELFEYAQKINIPLFSSAFDITSVDFLETLGNPIYKIASFEAIDINLIAKAASTKKPLIISTGIATLGEIAEAVTTARQSGCPDITLLHCTSSYPAPIEKANIRTIPELANIFKTRVGLSDHTLGIEACVVSIALGAEVIEKHFAMNPENGGVDAAFSLSPKQFEQLVIACNNAKKAMGSVFFRFNESENKDQRQFARSIYAVKDILPGHEISHENVKSIRPGFGLHPRELPTIIGKRASHKIPKGKPISLSDINFN